MGCYILKLWSLFVASVLALSACGGGGGGGTTTPPTPKPASKIAISFSSLGTTSQARRTQANPTCPTSSLSAPTVLQAEANWNPPTGTSWSAIDGNIAQATEFDANCNVISSSPTFTINDPTLVTTTIPAWVGSLPAAPSGQTYIFGSNPGLSTITATFPDNTSASTQIHVYGQMGVGCSPTYYLGSNGLITRGWSDASGQVTAVDACGYSGSNNAPLDFQMDPTGTTVLIPGGYDIVEASSPTNTISVNDLTSISNCSSFQSQGTRFQLIGAPPSFLMVFKTQDGKCVKFFSQQIQNNAIVGLFALSDSSGNFSN